MAPGKIDPVSSANPGTALAQVPLPRVLGSIIDGLLKAQDQLDAHAAQKGTEYVRTPSGTLAVPPLWYAFSQVRVDIEMSASVATTGSPAGADSGGSVFLCRLVNPASVSLFGYQASAGLKISLQLAVKGEMAPKTEGPPAKPPA